MCPDGATHIRLTTKAIERKKGCLFPCGHRIIDLDGNLKAEYFCEECAAKAGFLW